MRWRNARKDEHYPGMVWLKYAIDLIGKRLANDSNVGEIQFCFIKPFDAGKNATGRRSRHQRFIVKTNLF